MDDTKLEKTEATEEPAEETCCCGHGREEHEHEHEHEHHPHHDEDCECGCHDHEHEHHHHDHDHEHEHEHHPHHDEDCECGCHDHEHEHEHHHHDHDHEHHHHDHDHEHHHHHHELVEISHHEGAVIGALKGAIPVADYEKAETMLAEQMREAGRRVTEAGGIIGHIKFVLTSPGACGQISVTDINENIRRFDGTSSSIEGVAIVFAVEDAELKKILEETIGSILIREGH